MERAWLSLPGGGMAIFCINWSEKAATVNWVSVRGDAVVLDGSGNQVTPPVSSGLMTVPGRDVRIVFSGR